MALLRLAVRAGRLLRLAVLVGCAVAAVALLAGIRTA